MLNLAEFCAGPDDPREYLRQPMRTPAGIVYTNGQVMAIVQDDGEECQSAPGSIASTIQGMVSKYQGGDSWIKACDIELPEAKACNACNGVGAISHEPCPDCDGEGDFWHGSHSYLCKECDGSGTIESAGGDQEKVCRRCNGHKGEFISVDVLGSSFDRKYLAMLARLPNCELSPGGVYNIAPFRFEGGHGFLIPTRWAP